MASTQAETERTQQQTQAGKQGTLYGLDDYIAQQKDAIAKGLITPTQADQALTARISGTDVFSAAKASNDAMMQRTNQQIEQRTTDTAAATQRAATFGGVANAGLGQFMGLNNTVQPGSDAAGKGLLAYLDMMQGKLGQMSPTLPQVQSPALPPMLQQFSGQPAPSAAAGPVAPITINIGGGQPGPAAPQPVAATAPAQPLPMLDKMRPATTQDVAALWGQGGATPMNRASGGQF